MSSIATKNCLSTIINVLFSKLRTQYPEAHRCSRQPFSQWFALKTRIHIFDIFLKLSATNDGLLDS